MRLSETFIKTEKKVPSGEQNPGIILLERAGFVRKVGSGIYSFLPFGFLVLKKIERIIAGEMERLGAQRILMPALSPKKNWEMTGRWKTFDTLFRLKGVNNQEYALCPTHEEIVVPLVNSFNLSYKNLPFSVYQIQTKFRDEKRAKFGLLRTKEFLMKDLYSFHSNKKDLDLFYEKVKKVYFKIFKKLSLEKNTYLTLAKGGTFSQFSHEFQTVSEWGEDIIYVCDNCRVGLNRELIKKESDKKCWKCGKKLTKKVKAIEVGNIFKLGDKFSKPFSLVFRDRDGREKPVLMGCYGLGITRIMGAIVDIHHDEKGLIWPKTVSPFSVHLIALENDRKVIKGADNLYKTLKKEGIEVLYDDRKEKTPGEKLVDADLIGVPLRIVISKRTILLKKIEIKERGKKKSKLVSKNQLISSIKQ